MGKQIPMIGKKFNRLYVESFHSKDEKCVIRFNCLCDCGNSIVAKSFEIRSGRTKSCGCHLEDKDKVTRFKVGQQIERFTILEELDKNKHGRYYYRCLCSCGKEFKTSALSIYYHKTQSCGCLKVESTRLMHKAKRPDIGSTFGHWTVLETIVKYVDLHKRRVCRLICACTCGEVRELIPPDVLLGKSTNCGCIARENLRNAGVLRRKALGIFSKDARELLRALRRQISSVLRVVRIRDKKQCLLCGSETKVQVHHIEPLLRNPKRAHDPFNLVCLCTECHYKAHNGKFGKCEVNTEIAQVLTKLVKFREESFNSLARLGMPVHELERNIASILQDL